MAVLGQPRVHRLLALARILLDLCCHGSDRVSVGMGTGLAPEKQPIGAPLSTSHM